MTLLIKWDPQLKMGFDRADYSDAQIDKFLAAEAKDSQEKSMQILTVYNTINAAREQHLQKLNDICTASVEMLKAAVAEKEQDAADDPMEDEEDEEEDEEALMAINKDLRVALSAVLNGLVDASVISKEARTFMIDLIKNNKFDISNLQPKDLQFLASDCEIIRQRNVNGEILLQLNDFE
jgi:hypothetical protein